MPCSAHSLANPAETCVNLLAMAGNDLAKNWQSVFTNSVAAQVVVLPGPPHKLRSLIWNRQFGRYENATQHQKRRPVEPSSEDRRY